jgi:hypothetical protein
MNAAQFSCRNFVARFRLFALMTAVVLSSAIPAMARTFFVFQTDDSTSAASLRGAILTANRLGGHNVIVLSSSVYHLTIQGIDEDAGRTGDLDVTRGSLLIISPKGNAIIDASNLGDRIFQVMNHAKLTIRGVTLRGGHAFGGDYGSLAHEDGQNGGAILNAGQLTLQNCVLTGNAGGDGGVLLGNAPGGVGGSGGAIYNLGTLTMQNCRVEGNSSGAALVSSFGGNGGGIFNGGQCTLTACVIAGNFAGAGGTADSGMGDGGSGGNGGGICNTGIMMLKKCTISGNLTGSGTDGTLPGLSSINTSGSPGGSGGDGGGVFNSGKLQLNLCTVSGNTSGNGGNGGSGMGGGGDGGAGGSGGGIFDIGTLILESCTISSNFTGHGGDAGGGGIGEGGNGGAGGNGGGISCESETAARLRNSLIALNSTADGGTSGSGGFSIGVTNLVLDIIVIGPGPGPGPVGPIDGSKGSGNDLSGSFNSGDANAVSGILGSGGFNLIGDVTGSSGITNGFNSDLAGNLDEPIDPLLGPLQDNGGPTFTHALLPGSPAIDQGKSSFTGSRTTTDQRGRLRPVQSSVPNPPGGDGSDIGAFEVQNASARGGSGGR